MINYFIYIISFILPLITVAFVPEGRGPATPLISGDTFRFFADHVFDEVDSSLNPNDVQIGDTVFIKTDYLAHFFERIHPYITHPYIVISHNSDDPAPGPFFSFLEDPKILAWFAQNYDGYPHSKLYPIPIGIANACWPHGDFKQILEIKSRQIAKKYLAYLNINVNTFSQERKTVFKLFEKKRFCHKGKPQEYSKFLKELAAAYFVISPRGNGLDTHRLWESLYVGSVPIVKHSSLDPLYEGLPVLIIDSWEQVSEKWLQAKREELGRSKKWLDKLSIYYWIDLIRQVQKTARDANLLQNESAPFTLLSKHESSLCLANHSKNEYHKNR